MFQLPQIEATYSLMMVPFTSLRVFTMQNTPDGLPLASERICCILHVICHELTDFIEKGPC